jgi:hypothetical protein
MSAKSKAHVSWRPGQQMAPDLAKHTIGAQTPWAADSNQPPDPNTYHFEKLSQTPTRPGGLEMGGAGVSATASQVNTPYLEKLGQGDA